MTTRTRITFKINQGWWQDAKTNETRSKLQAAGLTQQATAKGPLDIQVTLGSNVLDERSSQTDSKRSSNLPGSDSTIINTRCFALIKSSATA
jgi:hypothetical protein